MAITTIDDSLPQHSDLPPSFTSIIFDMDGTLVDSINLIVKSFNYAARRFLPRELSIQEGLSVQGCTLEDQLSGFVPQSTLHGAVERYHEYFVHNFHSEVHVYPGIPELLGAFQDKGVRLAVCTAADRESARHTLVRSGLLHFFSTIVTGDDVKVPKPDPEGLRVVMRAIKANAADTLYIGDHPNDIRAAQTAGANSAAALWGAMRPDELQESKPDFAFKDPSQVGGQTN